MSFTRKKTEREELFPPPSNPSEALKLRGDRLLPFLSLLAFENRDRPALIEMSRVVESFNDTRPSERSLRKGDDGYAAVAQAYPGDEFRRQREAPAEHGAVDRGVADEHSGPVARNPVERGGPRLPRPLPDARVQTVQQTGKYQVRVRVAVALRVIVLSFPHDTYESELHRAP